MTATSEFLDRQNLDRAWRWIRSNPDAMYKRYCGELYSRFALADDLLIDELRQRLQRGFYEPDHSCKLLVPKKSGILRPYTILTVQDQIVYQALVNVVAERLGPRIRNRYLRQTFGHIYAGRTSQWFYKKWSDGYTAFNKAARDAFSRGLVYSASFDLTAFYDSVDHGVLCHFLAKLGCEKDFCDFLRSCLSKWTATDRRIYQFHGIPQGPLSSGLLSEVVLQHFDQYYGAKADLVYLRFVDDIRLFAKREVDLRRMLVRLDHLSKDVGLFPQVSKIDIHRVTDINRELKSISNPTEAAVRGAVVDQVKLANRLIALSPRLTPIVRIEDETRFKYLLAHAVPSARINGRMLTISATRPDLVPAIARYFARYKALPRRIARDLIQRVGKSELYENVTAEWLNVLQGRIKQVQIASLNKTLKRLWGPRSLGAELKGMIGANLIREGLLTLNQTRYATRYVPEWWVRAQLVAALGTRHYGTATLQGILDVALRDQNSDVSLAAAQQIADLNVTVLPPLRGINVSAGKALRQLGVLRRIPGRTCGIEWSFARFTGRTSTLNWRTVFGFTYRHAEKLAVQMRALADTNVTAFVNASDVFNDRLLCALYLHDPTLGTYTLGNLGSVLSSARLRTRYPAVFQLCCGIHNERLKSSLSHPIIRKTGRPTSRISYRYIRTAKRLYVQAIAELESLWWRSCERGLSRCL
ncbi:MAG: RNA-directed DNA polymerase [Terracidiphilus sp.]|jgi:hypothetical protein